MERERERELSRSVSLSLALSLSLSLPCKLFEFEIALQIDVSFVGSRYSSQMKNTTFPQQFDLKSTITLSKQISFTSNLLQKKGIWEINICSSRTFPSKSIPFAGIHNYSLFCVDIFASLACFDIKLWR